MMWFCALNFRFSIFDSTAFETIHIVKGICKSACQILILVLLRITIHALLLPICYIILYISGRTLRFFSWITIFLIFPTGYRIPFIRECLAFAVFFIFFQRKIQCNLLRTASLFWIMLRFWTSFEITLIIFSHLMFAEIWICFQGLAIKIAVSGASGLPATFNLIFNLIRF